MFTLRALGLLFCLLQGVSAFGGEKLIALTFDDGPRPYVLYGTRESQSSRGLLDLLDHYQVKATFFVMGWRLTPKTWGEPRAETNIGITCLDAAKDVLKRGHEIENHTFTHNDLRIEARKKGDAAVIEDVEHGARVIEAVVGGKPKYLRPPDWDLPPALRAQVEERGFQVMTISSDRPLALRDINSLDYLCAGKHPVQCPKPSLAQAVMKQIEGREKNGTTTHILTVHELSTTTTMLSELIPAFQQRGYRFVRLDEYMRQVH